MENWFQWSQGAGAPKFHSPVLSSCLPPQIVIHVTDLLFPLSHQGWPLPFQAQEVAALVVLHVQEEAVRLQEAWITQGIMEWVGLAHFLSHHGRLRVGIIPLKLTFSMVTRVCRLLSRTCFSFVSCQGGKRESGPWEAATGLCWKGGRPGTHVILAAGRHYGVDHLPGVVDTGDGEFSQRALKLHCRKEGAGKLRDKPPQSLDERSPGAAERALPGL